MLIYTDTQFTPGIITIYFSFLDHPQTKKRCLRKLQDNKNKVKSNFREIFAITLLKYKLTVDIANIKCFWLYHLHRGLIKITVHILCINSHARGDFIIYIY